jgi:pyrroline-5-carboxylate reductase
MPSIAIDKAEGVIGYTEPNNEYIEKIFNELGYSFKVDENDIEKVTAFVACGLGFASYILSAFQNTGETLGFTNEISEKIVKQTFINAINMGDFAETAKAVANKGGATEQGIICFEENKLQHTIEEAVQRAYKKMI